jgi:diadenosine tetraphosphate (Ap4A) HIT family hydrolase
VADADCELCREPGGEVLWSGDLCRVVLVAEPDYPGLCRVILSAHVAEMTDLGASEQAALMRVVLATEAAIRAVLRPDKVNLASLGNVVPHLHWHVVPRYRDDRHFPRPIWAAATRETAPARQVDASALRAELARRL